MNETREHKNTDKTVCMCGGWFLLSILLEFFETNNLEVSTRLRTDQNGWTKQIDRIENCI